VDWRQGDGHQPPQSVTDISSSHDASLRRAVLSCGLPASRRRPPGLVPHGFGISRLVVHFLHLAVFGPGAPGSVRTLVTFLRLGPHFRVLPEHPWRRNSDADTLTRFFAPSATHPPRSTTPGLCLPGSRCALALTMCLDALLPRRTPWCPFNQARSRGDPSELDLTEIAAPLGAASPPAISGPTAVADTWPA